MFLWHFLGLLLLIIYILYEILFFKMRRDTFSLVFYIYRLVRHVIWLEFLLWNNHTWASIWIKINTSAITTTRALLILPNLICKIILRGHYTWLHWKGVILLLVRLDSWMQKVLSAIGRTYAPMCCKIHWCLRFGPVLFCCYGCSWLFAARRSILLIKGRKLRRLELQRRRRRTGF